MCWYRLTGGVERSIGRAASDPAAKESNSTRFSSARRNCQRPSDIRNAIRTMVSSVVNGRGAKMREPILIDTIYCLSPVQPRWAAVEFKYLVVAMLVLILISLGKALFHLTSSNPQDGIKMVKALAWRIGLSVALFVLLIVGYYSGWIDPHRVVPGYRQ